ncbi:Protein trichome birefringence-like 28 [Rhodotorula toruloides]|nr:Protein trichome birefringence-like 28 [Rhodotorula toruloides]
MTGYPYTALSPLQRRRQQWYSLFAVAVILLFFSAATYRHPDALPDLPTLSTFSRLRYCRNDEIAEGSWVPAPVDGRTWARLKVSAGYTCHDNRHALMCFTNEPSELPRLAAANSWRWQPRDCQLRSFDAAALVRRLSRNARQGKNGSGILFVGDSLQLQHSQSFECMMGDHIERGFLSDYEVGNFSLEDGAGQVGFVRTDYLL